VLAARAEVETALGNPAAAAAAGEAAGGGADAVLARAVALLLQPGSADRGTRLYFEAVDVMGDGAADRFYRDVEPIVQGNEAADWKVADPAGRRQWLHRFWTRRAAEAGVLVSERLAEHYGRLAIARREYLRNSRRGAASAGVLVDELAANPSPFDDRGLILIRRGVPQHVVSTTQDGVLPNETWIYTEPGASADRIFHFAALRGARDFSLISDLLQAVDPVTARGAVDRQDNAILQLLEDRALYEPGYQAAVGRVRQLLAQGYRVDGTEIRSTLEQVDADYRHQVRQALGTDVQFARFDRSIDFHYDLFAFRTPFGRTDLTAGFAVQAVDLAAEEMGGGRVAYPLLVSLILIDTLADVVTRRDTLERVEVAARLGPGDFVRTHVELPVIASENTIYRVAVRSPAIGSGSVRNGGAVLRDFGGAGLQVSDLVLAEPDSIGDWVRGAIRLTLTLPRRYPPGRPFTLFYEVYNLPTDARYRTHVRVESAGRGAFGRIRALFGGGGPRIDVRYEDVADPDADGVIQEVRRVDTGLPPGRYRMRVTVENEATGERAESAAEFEVVD
jgi:GWxTD domain-containing protein